MAAAIALFIGPSILMSYVTASPSILEVYMPFEYIDLPQACDSFHILHPLISFLKSAISLSTDSLTSRFSAPSGAGQGQNTFGYFLSRVNSCCPCISAILNWGMPCCLSPKKSPVPSIRSFSAITVACGGAETSKCCFAFSPWSPETSMQGGFVLAPADSA